MQRADGSSGGGMVRDEQQNHQPGKDTLQTELSSFVECGLCLSLLCEPVSISCGHTFCRVCLVKALRRHKKQCPQCREVCHVAPESAAENVVIKNVALLVDSRLYNERLAESAAEKATWSTLYPAFYYNSCMFPGSRLSLHLFEPRYKLMMQRVVNTTRAFAYVPNFRNYEAQVGEVAMVAELKEVEFMADGRCLLEAILSRRKKIVDHYVEEGTQGLHFVRLENFEDHPLQSEAAIQEVDSLISQGRTLSQEVMKDRQRVFEHQFGPAPPDTERELFSLWLTAVCPLPESTKIAMFTNQDTRQRLDQCISSLDSFLNQPSIIDAASNSVNAIARHIVDVVRARMRRQSSSTSSGDDNEGNDNEEVMVEDEEEDGDANRPHDEEDSGSEDEVYLDADDYEEVP